MVKRKGVIKISLYNLIYMIPDLINLFLSGFIFMLVFNWINNKKSDISVVVIWSLFISYIIQALCSAIHMVIFPNIDFNDSLKILIYIAVGFILAATATWVKSIKFINNVLYKINNKSINDDIFDDIIDYDEPTMLCIYLKSSEIYYIGKFCYREEKGLDSWIVLINYCVADRNTNNIIFDSKEASYNSVTTVNLKDVERIEIIYEDDSEVWKRLSGISSGTRTQFNSISKKHLLKR